MTKDASPVDLSPQDLAAWLNEQVDGTLMGHLGIRAVEVGSQRAVTELDVHPRCQDADRPRPCGRALLSLADTTATYLAVASIGGSYIDLARFPVAIGLSSQIIGNVQDGVLRAESTLVHGGRTLLVVETRVTSAPGRLLATVNSTHFVRDSGVRGDDQETFDSRSRSAAAK